MLVMLFPNLQRIKHGANGEENNKSFSWDISLDIGERYFVAPQSLGRSTRFKRLLDILISSMLRKWFFKFSPGELCTSTRTTAKGDKIILLLRSSRMRNSETLISLWFESGRSL